MPPIKAKAPTRESFISRRCVLRDSRVKSECAPSAGREELRAPDAPTFHKLQYMLTSDIDIHAENLFPRDVIVNEREITLPI